MTDKSQKNFIWEFFIDFMAVRNAMAKSSNFGHFASFRPVYYSIFSKLVSNLFFLRIIMKQLGTYCYSELFDFETKKSL